MNKKIMIIVGIIIICIIGGILFFANNNKTQENSNTESADNTKKEETEKVGDGKVLVVYFSATNNTKTVAEEIAKELNADLFEIVPTEEYTSEDLDWTNENSRVSKEHENESLRNVALKTTTVENWDSYDTVLIGYPIWWGIAAWPVDTFVKANDFNGKTIIPFCTSASSDLGESGKLLEQEANGGTWLEGYRFSSSASETDIKVFIDKIK